MKKLLFLVITMTCAAMTMACAKSDPVDSVVIPETGLYSNDFDIAVQGNVEDATIYFYNEDNLLLDERTIRISGYAVPVSFESDSEPVWLYTEGLQNADDNLGRRRIKRRMITKATTASNERIRIDLVIQK